MKKALTVIFITALSANSHAYDVLARTKNIGAGVCAYGLVKFLREEKGNNYKLKTSNNDLRFTKIRVESKAPIVITYMGSHALDTLTRQEILYKCVYDDVKMTTVISFISEKEYMTIDTAFIRK